MSAYSRRQVVRFCLLTAVVTAVVGAIFVETAYPSVRRAAASWIGGEDEQPRPEPRPPAGDLRDSTTLEVLQRRTEELLEARATELGIEKQKELMLLWHDLRIWQNLWYLGIRIQKNPMDTWMMQQILYEVQPDYVIETGTAYGGSALYWAHILDGLGLEDSRVITIDIENFHEQAAEQPLWQKRVDFIHGSSTDPTVVDQVRELVQGKRVLVTLDSDHTGEHVLAELRAYGPMVSPGSYIVVEDTNMDGLPIPQDYLNGEPGPMWGVLQYLEGEGGELFEQDFARENFVLTFNPGGWLKRKAPASSSQ